MAAPAQAASVSTTSADGKGGGGSISYQAAPGEANQLAVVAATAGRLRLSDSAAVIEVKDAGCRRVDDHTVDCASAPIHAELLDGDDSAVIDPAVTEPASLSGGAGADLLRGGGGKDNLRGDDGADALDGGPGRDTLDYSDHTAGVTVDLAAPGTPVGASGEGDRATAFENVSGGAGDDTLLGNNGANVLVGNAGRNVLRGRGGADRLDSQGSIKSPSSDDDDGGAGADVIVVAGPGFTTVRCGSGRDVVSPAGTTVLAADCERWTLLVFAHKPELKIAVVPSVSGRRVTFRLPCPRRAPGTRCVGGLTLRDSRTGLLVAAKTYRARSSGARATVAVRMVLSAADARRVRGSGLRLQIAFELTVRGRGVVDRGRGGYTFLLG